MFHSFSRNGENIKLHIIEVGNKDLKSVVIFFLLEVERFFSLISNLSFENFRILLVYKCDVLNQSFSSHDVINVFQSLMCSLNIENTHFIFEPDLDDHYKYSLYGSDLFDSITICKRFDEICMQAFFAAAPLKAEDQLDFIEKVNMQISNSLSEGEPYLIKVAKKMRLTPRVLSKRIKNEGEEFKHLVKQKRHEKALFLLKNQEIGLSEIAYTLGYTEHSAFTRAFRKWTGFSPCQFRKNALDSSK